MQTDRYDELFLLGREAVLAGRPELNAPPVDGGGRWGMSVILRPEADVAARLGALTAEALPLAGPGQWPTGSPDTVHFTLRSLADYRAEVPDGDPLAARCLAALRTAAAAVDPIRIALTGLSLTPTSVMLRTEPDGDGFDRLDAAFGAALGPDGARERGIRRTIRHANLVHFAAPVARPRALVDWVADRRRLDLGDSVLRAADLIVWRHHEGRGMRIHPLATVPLGDAPRPADHP